MMHAITSESTSFSETIHELHKKARLQNRKCQDSSKVRAYIALSKSSLAQAQQLLTQKSARSRDYAIAAIGWACLAAKQKAIEHYLPTQDFAASLRKGAELLTIAASSVPPDTKGHS
jgi:hypothetical protein